MEIPHEMPTLSEIMKNFRNKGFTEDYDFIIDKFVVKSKQESYDPKELTIVQVYRFEGNSDPSDMEVLYAIESGKGTKGLFIDAFGAYGAQDGQKLAAAIKSMKIAENHSKE